MAMATATNMALGSKVSLKPTPASRGFAQAARLRCGPVRALLRVNRATSYDAG